MTEQTQSAEQAQPQQESGLSLSDLQGAVQVIDLASQRGAIRGEEMSAVGALRDRLSRFVESAAPKEEAGAEAAPAEGETTQE